MADALAKPEVKEKLLAIGLIPVGRRRKGWPQELAANTAFWQPIVKATGLQDHELSASGWLDADLLADRGQLGLVPDADQDAAFDLQLVVGVGGDLFACWW